MPWPARTALASLLAALLALVACATARADAPLPADYFGMNLNRVLYDDHSPMHAVPLAAARAAGVTHGRIDFAWSAVQPAGPRSANYDSTDKAVTALVNQNITPAPMLGYSPNWAASVPGDDKTPPRNLSDFAHFAEFMVQRYGPSGSFWRRNPRLPYLPVHRWEVWNEPNLPQVFWQTGRNPELYARMYIATRAAIKAVDPSAQVITAGMHSADIGFVTEMYQSHPELRGQVDGLAIHPYGSSVQAVLDAVKRFRAALDAQGETAVPMEVTEVGWQRQGNTSVTLQEAQRAPAMGTVTTVLAHSDCGIDAFEPFTWETAERNPSDGEDWYGMWSPTAGLLPTGQAYANAVAAFATPDAKVAARGSQELRICHLPPPPLRLRIEPRRTGLRLQVRAGNKGLPGALVGLRVAVRGRRRTHVEFLVSGKHGYAFFRVKRTTTKVSAVAAATGFAASQRVEHRFPRARARARKLHRR